MPPPNPTPRRKTPMVLDGHRVTEIPQAEAYRVVRVPTGVRHVRVSPQKPERVY